MKEESINPTTTVPCKIVLEKLKNQAELEKTRNFDIVFIIFEH